MFVRLFCMPQQNALSDFTRQLIDLILVHLGMSVRLLPISGAVELPVLEKIGWEGYQILFGTYVDGPYVNIVSSNDPADWSRLWTTNVTNILVTTSVPPPMDPMHMLYGGAYQAVIVPTSKDGEIYGAWHAASEAFQHMAAIVLPTPWSPEHALAIRDVILT